MFNDKIPHAIFPNVQVTDKFVTEAKGTKCVKVGYIGGEQVFFDKELFAQVEVGETLTIKANVQGDFYGNVQISDHSRRTPSALGPDEPATKRRRAT